MTVAYFLLMVGLLVLVHELGHFTAAKLLGVRVERFSIGYGRPLLQAELGETVYQLGMFPIGGYVRIRGVDDADALDEVGRGLEARPLWQRLTVVFAGPAANFILATLIYFVFFAGQRALPAAVIGDVLPESPAARAGLEAGDTVLEVNGTAMRYWEDVEREVQESEAKELRFRVQRRDKTIEKFVVPSQELVRRRDGRVRREGRIGITHAPFVPLVGVLDPTSPAGKAGLRTGDLIVSVDGMPVKNWDAVQRRMGRQSRRTNISYLRGTEVPGVPMVRLLSARFADVVPDTQFGQTLQRTTYTGLERAEMFVATVEPGSPADQAGLRPGDLITKVDGEAVQHWLELDQRLQSAPDRAWVITWRRNTDGTIAEHQATVTQVWRQQSDAYGHAVTRLVFGARNDGLRGQGAMIAIDGRFGYALSRSVERTVETTSTMVNGFWSMLNGDAPSEAVGGPLMMYQVTAVSSGQGWGEFWLLIALISINLGLINLLPLPMLDGGHAVLYTLEAIRGRPLTTRARDRIAMVGLVAIVSISVLAVKNDVMRYFFR